jgi:hypothetical protein
MQAIRYRKGFRMQCVREVEAGQNCAYAVQRKYKIKGTATVMRWVRQFGSGRYGKIIRVEQPHEVNEAGQLRSELRRVKEALADAHRLTALGDPAPNAPKWFAAIELIRLAADRD